MPVIEKTGDMFTSDAPAWGHGVNTVGLMGAGIAVAFKRRYPEMHRSYAELCRLGKFKPGSTLAWYDESDEMLVLNMASQELPGAYAKYSYLQSSFEGALLEIQEKGLNRFAIPRIGCGIGGLDWARVLPILEEVSARFPDITVEVWSLN